LRHSPELENDFPNLATAGYDITSDPANPPTCIGFALDDVSHIWDANGAAIKFPGYIWLPNGPYDFEMKTVARIFELHRYVDCNMDASFEAGYEKVALYIDDHDHDEPFSHVARQRPDGTWISKLGPDEDLTHNTLDALEGDTQQFAKAYGRVERVMKRQIT